MTSRVTVRELRSMLIDRVDQLLADLPPDWRKHSSGAVTALNPNHAADRRPGSFVVWTATGAWKDFAAGDKGDVIDLLSYAHGRGVDRKWAIGFAKEWLGIEKMSSGERAAARAALRKKDEARRAAQEAEAARRRDRAWTMWLKAPVNHIAGTVAETYLATRGVRLAEVPNPERGELRFSPEMEWWNGAVWGERDGRRVKEQPGPKFPAMIAIVRGARGEPMAVHVTFLADDGQGKAPVARPKLMFAGVTGGVVRIARGPSNLTPEQAADAGVAGPLVITEGIEDALSIAVALPEARVWAATSLSNVGNAPAFHPCVSGVIVAADNDWAGGQAAAELERAVERLEAHGRPVEVRRPPAGFKDFNDLLRGEEEGKS